MAFALPVTFLPLEAYVFIYGFRYDPGWPLSTVDMFVAYVFQNGPHLHFLPYPLLLPVAMVWTLVAALACRARAWAGAHTGWTGALVQAAFTSLYCAILFVLLNGVSDMVWEWRMTTMQWPALKQTLFLRQLWLTCFYAAGAAGIFITLFLDSRTRRGPRRLFHVAFALCFALVSGWLASYLACLLGNFDYMIRFARITRIIT